MIGTWRMAIVATDDPSSVFVTKNVGPCFLGKSKNQVIICQDNGIQSAAGTEEGIVFEKLKSNILYEIKDNCQIMKTKLEK